MSETLLDAVLQSLGVPAHLLTGQGHYASSQVALATFEEMQQRKVAWLQRNQGGKGGEERQAEPS